MGKTTKEVHPSIAQFKEFVKKHPKLIKEVRAERKTWQELYEDWYLFGEEDETWKQYRDIEEGAKQEQKEEKNDFLTKLVQSLKKMDMNEMQYHIANVNSAITNIQQVIQQFQPNRPSGGSGPSAPQHPFGFRKD
ncbi:MAG TPA: YlbD family protein [Bacillus sp. (in: firmicutes)]|nr:YlbD family protein [Bacillus sp. (in: firmicutes)]